ncbi:hypothetical protein BC826DRAFT_441535 [Russula brevipes]|nr:hypothetical protein BC826DRAFT_441535 [Russula brevipes]
MESSQPFENPEGHFRHSTDIARLEPSTSPTALSSSSDSDSPTPIVPPSSPASPPSPDSVQAINTSMQQPHMFIINDSSIAISTASSSSVFISSRLANVSGTSMSTSRSPSQSIVTATSPPIVQATAPPAPVPPVPPPHSPSPANVHSGESIYRTIMNRLSALEANTTLYARYVEEQTNAMREMLRRLSEDVGRLEGIGRAQAQMYARSISEFEKHRREMDTEQRTLISQVNYLAEEIVMEKRLGIAQLCLLLAVLVFLSITRGSPGEFHIARSRDGADVRRSGGQRSLKPSSDWLPSHLRSVSSGPRTTSQDSHTPKASVPTTRTPQPTPATAAPPTTFLSLPATTGHAGHFASKALTASTPTHRPKRPPLYITPIQHHAHHHRVPRSRSTHARTRAGGASPTPVPCSARVPTVHSSPDPCSSAPPGAGRAVRTCTRCAARVVTTLVTSALPT